MWYLRVLFTSEGSREQIGPTFFGNNQKNEIAYLVETQSRDSTSPYRKEQGKVVQACPTVRRPRVRPRTCCRDSERLSVPPDGERRSGLLCVGCWPASGFWERISGRKWMEFPFSF